MRSVQVLYIAGSGRSGSTLLARILGEVPGILNVGEAARFLYNHRMLERNRTCECGVAVECCSFWREHLRLIDPTARRFSSRFARIRYLPLILFPFKVGGMDHGAARLRRSLAALYHELAARSGSHTIVDASKNPANALLLARASTVELHVVHMVRDSRGTVSSWSRPKGYLRRHSVAKTVAWWISQNLAAEFLRKRSATYSLLRYEDFMLDPRGEIQGILSTIGRPSARLPSFSGSRVLVHPQHALAGNPDKYEGGWLDLRARTWSLPIGTRFLVTAMTLPLLWHYGYSLGESPVGLTSLT